MYTGTLTDDLFASVERAEDSASRSLPQGTNPHTPQIVSIDSEVRKEKVKARTVPAGAWSERG